MQCSKPKYCIVIWIISNRDLACIMYILGESYEFYKTSWNNELAEETGVRFDNTTLSFHPKISQHILRYVFF